MEQTGNSPARKNDVITLSDYRDLARKKPKKNKYNAQKTAIDGEVIDSKGEAQRYAALKLLARLGKIRDLKRQVRIPLIVNGTQIATEDKLGRRRKLFYIADWTYFEDEAFVIEDFKGYDTPLSRLKRAIVEAVTGIQVRVTKR